MPDVLLATDADWLFDDVVAALGGTHDVHRVREGSVVAEAVATVEPELIICLLYTSPSPRDRG